jgi:hypothetical protein
MSIWDVVFKVGWVGVTTTSGISTVTHFSVGSLVFVGLCAALGVIAGDGFNDWRKNLKHGTTDKTINSSL